MATSRYGEGSIFFDTAKGLYVGQLELGADADGRRRRKTVKAKTKVALLAKMREVRAAVDSGLPVTDGRTTTGEWLDQWVTDVLPGKVADSTLENYRIVLRVYVAPHVGKVPLAKLTPEHVQRMMRALEESGLSARTQALARKVLRRALGDAERWGKVPRNVAALVDPPRKAFARTDDALDADEAAKVIATAKGDRLEALAVLVLAVGLRQGEALDLLWSDVDLDGAALRVSQAKTASGIRTVALPPMVVTALRDHRARQREERMAATRWDDPDRVFATTVGSRMNSRNTLRWWHELTIAAGVGRRRFHASRHTAATLMLNNGVPLEVVSKTLGHAGLAITADVYAKVRPELQRKAADAMETVLGGR